MHKDVGFRVVFFFFPKESDIYGIFHLRLESSTDTEGNKQGQIKHGN